MSEKMSQKDVVYEAIKACEDESGSFDREEVIAYMMSMYESGKLEIKSQEKKKSEKAIKEYCGSLISNWVRKDPRLSGEATSEEAPSREKQKRKPADDEMKRLMRVKTILMSEGKATDEIDLLISDRTVEIVNLRSKGKEIAEAKAKAILGI